MPQKPIDEALFAQMWNDGKSMHAIQAAIGLNRSRLAERAHKMGLAPRVMKQAVEPVEGKRAKYTSKPKADAKAKAKPAPVYHHGLMADLKRANGSAIAIGQIAARYRVPRAELYAMAGVAV